MSLEYLQEIANDYEKLLENDKRYDVLIYAGEKENVKELHALSNILCSRSQYFYDILTKENVEKKGGKFVLKVPDIPPQIFKIILRFIYCGKVDLTKLEGTGLLELLKAASALNLQSLVLGIEEHLIKDHYEFLQKKNPIEILETIYQQESFTKLRNFYLEKICENPKEIFNSDKFINIKASLLEFLLKRDDLSLKEIEVWDSLIKWSFGQNPSIPKDVNKWSKEETIIMERTLHRYIPLVRFHYMSSEEFLKNVLPFRDLLPKDLIINLLEYALAPDKKLSMNIQPPRQLKLVYDSILVKPHHFAIFSSWIDKKENLHYNEKKIPYQFNLLYRNSRDGNTAAAFHQKCDNKGATIVIAKINNSEQIVGGYNPLYWDQSGVYKSTKDSFIFSFVKTNLKTAKVGYIIDNRAQYAIYCNQSHGPIFGGGWDIYCNNDNTWKSDNNPNTYSQIDIPKGKFQVDDYEVFKVTKR